MDKDARFGMRVSPEFMSLIDDWRREQPDIPPRAEAIRRLVLAGYVLLSRPEKVIETMVAVDAQLPEGGSYFEDPIGSGLLAAYLELRDHVDHPKFTDEANNVIELFPQGKKRGAP